MASRLARIVRRLNGNARTTARAVRDEPRHAVSYSAFWLRQRGVLPPKSLLPGGRRARRRLIHVANHTTGNAGDTLLPIVLRDLFDARIGRSKWTQDFVHDVVDDDIMRGFNRASGVVVGGGGLFLRDTNTNQVSGWQWPISADRIREIDVPLIVFALGYNRFRGQDDFGPMFAENVTALLEKSSFFGLRNHGSIRAIREYVPAELRDRIVFQPCMTTLVAHLYPERVASVPPAEPFIALNCAFDRSELRYGADSERVVAEIIEAARRLAAQMPLRYYAHNQTDLAFSRALTKAGVPHKAVSLQGRTPEQIIDAYTQPALAIGMRGHAQMIPFGCGTPILTLASHDKMRWFLQDIGHDEWGAEVAEPGVSDQIVDLATDLIDRAPEVRSAIRDASDRLWSISTTNLVQVGAALGA